MFAPLLVALSSVFNSASAAPNDPIEVTLATPVHAYVPKGFDNNDNAQIIVEGYLPSLCYKAPFAVTEITGHTVKITMKAYLTSAGPCAMAIVPYLETIDLGTLEKGKYEIIVNDGQPRSDKALLNVADAVSAQQDEHIYANLENIQKFSRSRKVTFHGYNPSDCFKFDRFEVTDNGKDTYSILPIMKQVHRLCPMKMTPFVLLFEVPETLGSDRVVLHVRTMNGKSVNTVFVNRDE